jgi:hypothetical protein
MYFHLLTAYCPPLSDPLMQGLKGEVGPKGDGGMQGEKGDAGDRGPQGLEVEMNRYRLKFT